MPPSVPYPGRTSAVVSSSGRQVEASGALAIRDLSTTVKLPIITASGNDKVDRPVAPYVLNNAPTSELVTSSLRYAVENFGAKKVAAIHYETDFSSQIPDALKTGCQRLGCEVVTVEKGSATSSVDAGESKASASPRKPSVTTRQRSSSARTLLVA